MDWAKREFAKKAINRAGQDLIVPNTCPETLESSLEVINNWRAAHHYPLNTFKVRLRRKSHEVDPNSLVAQRIKRLSSIDLKLRRFPTMKLSQMQDIGGCRAIVTNINHVRLLVDKYENSDLKHKLDSMDDYISQPKASGYRGVHLIYKCFYDKPKSAVYNDQYIEMQIRSRQQHAWATAVETVGTFLNQSLKSSQGEKDWLRFFELMGSLMAFWEKSSLVPNTPTTNTELITEIKKYADDLSVIQTLAMFGHALKIGSKDIEKKKYQYFLLILEPAKKSMNINGFRREALEEATNKYLEVERKIENTPGSQVVLVSADSFNSLKRAFPNYFLDTIYFVTQLKKALTGSQE